MEQVQCFSGSTHRNVISTETNGCMRSIPASPAAYFPCMHAAAVLHMCTTGMHGGRWRGNSLHLGLAWLHYSISASVPQGDLQEAGAMAGGRGTHLHPVWQKPCRTPWHLHSANCSPNHSLLSACKHKSYFLIYP